MALKEGPAEDGSNKETIAKLLRFASTHTDSSAQTVSLEDYVSRMAEGQEKIITSLLTAMLLRRVARIWNCSVKGIEVLLLSDRIDEWMMSYLTEFEGKAFQSVSKADDSLNNWLMKKIQSSKKQRKHWSPSLNA